MTLSLPSSRAVLSIPLRIIRKTVIDFELPLLPFLSIPLRIIEIAKYFDSFPFLLTFNSIKDYLIGLYLSHDKLPYFSFNSIKDYRWRNIWKHSILGCSLSIPLRIIPVLANPLPLTFPRNFQFH